MGDDLEVVVGGMIGEAIEQKEMINDIKQGMHNMNTLLTRMEQRLEQIEYQNNTLMSYGMAVKDNTQYIKDDISVTSEKINSFLNALKSAFQYMS